MNGGERGSAPRTGSVEEGSRRVRLGRGPFAGGNRDWSGLGRRRRGHDAAAIRRRQAGRRDTGDTAVHRLHRLARHGLGCIRSAMWHGRFVAGRHGCGFSLGVGRQGAGRQRRESAEQHQQGLKRTHPAQLGARASAFKPGRLRDRDREPQAARRRGRDRAASGSRPASGRISSRPDGRSRRHGNRARGGGRWRRRCCRCR